MSVARLGDETSLKIIFRTLQNQSSAIFGGECNAHSASIMKCLEGLATLISPENVDVIEDLESFISGGVCHVARNYGINAESTISPIVLNFLMTAIRSYNHINRGKSPYRFTDAKCPQTNPHGNAFLAQVLIPHIDAGAHAFPIDEKLLTFEVRVEHSPIIRSPSPMVGRRGESVPFGLTFKMHQRHRRAHRKNIDPLGYRSNSSDTGSASDGGGRRKFTRRQPRQPRQPRQSRQTRHRNMKKRLL